MKTRVTFDSVLKSVLLRQAVDEAVTNMQEELKNEFDSCNSSIEVQISDSLGKAVIFADYEGIVVDSEGTHMHDGTITKEILIAV